MLGGWWSWKKIHLGFFLSPMVFHGMIPRMVFWTWSKNFTSGNHEFSHQFFSRVILGILMLVVLLIRSLLPLLECISCIKLCLPFAFGCSEFLLGWLAQIFDPFASHLFVWRLTWKEKKKNWNYQVRRDKDVYGNQRWACLNFWSWMGAVSVLCGR